MKQEIWNEREFEKQKKQAGLGGAAVKRELLSEVPDYKSFYGLLAHCTICEFKLKDAGVISRLTGDTYGVWDDISFETFKTQMINGLSHEEFLTQLDTWKRKMNIE